MRRVVNLLLFMVLLVSSAAAETRRAANLDLYVPFDFMVGNVMFPAGEYAATALGPHQIILRARHGRQSLTMTTYMIDDKSSDSPAGLVFSRARNHYQLIQIRMDDKRGQEIAAPLPVRPQAAGTKLIAVAFRAR